MRNQIETIMKKAEALIFLIIAANIFCSIVESKSVVDKEGRTKGTENSFEKYTEPAMNFIQRLFAAVKSPKGFITCVCGRFVASH